MPGSFPLGYDTSTLVNPVLHVPLTKTIAFGGQEYIASQHLFPTGFREENHHTIKSHFNNGAIMKRVLLACLAFIVSVAFASGQADNPLSKAAVNDWAKYTVDIQNATMPFLSVKDQEQWRIVSVIQPTGVRIDNYAIIAGHRSTMGGSIRYFNKPFEPVNELNEGAKINIISTTAENLTVKGKSYACTKIVRKVSRPVDASKLQTGWNGTSTIWLSPDVPVGGVVKIENRYTSQLTPDSKPNTITETWLLTDSGFKNWKP